MEVVLDALEGEAPPADTFVSMRIGDVQKQSRFASSRTYRFPDPGEGRSGFGRIEVFKRIGHLTVSFESLEGDAQDVEVPCDMLNKAFRMRLSVKGVEAAKEMEPLSTEKKGRTRLRLDAAQKYLSEHKLEETLAEAMREVIAAKPEDPHTFLSTQIMKHRSLAPQGGPEAVKAAAKPAPVAGKEAEEAEKAAPPPLPEPQKAAPPPLPEAQKAAPPALPEAQKAAAPPLPVVEKSSPPAVPEVQKSAPPAGPEPRMEKAAAPKASQLPAANFREYYAAHLSGRATSALDALYPRFAKVAEVQRPTPQPAVQPAQEKAAAPKASQPSAPSFREYYAAHLSGHATSALDALYPRFAKVAEVQRPAPQPAVQPAQEKAAAPEASQPPAPSFREYYAANLCGRATTALVALYPRFAKAAVKAPQQPKVEAAPTAASSSGAFGLKPSVGTWLGGVPVKPAAAVQREAPAVEVKAVAKAAEQPEVEATPAAASGSGAFCLKPSVGTWLGSLPVKHTAVVQREAPAVEVPKAVAEAPQRPVPAAASSSRAFGLKPSVGTWLGSLPVMQAAAVQREAPAVEAKEMQAAAQAPQQLKATPSAASSRPFGLKPSVGTWLGSLPVKQEAMVQNETPAVEETKVQAAAQAPQQLKATPSAASSRPFGLKPSVGTWLGSLPVEQEARVQNETPAVEETKVQAPQPAAPPLAFHVKPSVGSWLAPRPKQVEKPRCDEVKEEFDPQAMAHIVELQGIIAERDQELERLRARMKKYGLTESSRPCTPSTLGAPQAVAELFADGPSSPAAGLLRSMPSSPTARALLRGMSSALEAPKPLHVQSVALRSGADSLFDGLYGKFKPTAPAKAKPMSARQLAAEAQKAPAPAAAAPAASPEKKGQFALRPSVGTWLAPRTQAASARPSKEAALATAKENAKEALLAGLLADEPADASKEALLATAKEHAKEVLIAGLLADEAEEARKGAVLTKAKENAKNTLIAGLLADEKTEASKEVVLSKAKENAKEALIAGLLADEKAEASKAADLKSSRVWPLAPSVGTWVQSLPFEEQVALVQVVGRRKSSLKKMKNEDLIKSFKAEILRKDQEILDLKRLLGLL